MKIGLIGYQRSGKSTLFEWLTGAPSDPAQSHLTQTAMAPVPDDRVGQLCEIYHPKKVSLASLEITDTPGLSRDHEGSAGRLAMIREAGALVLVAAAFDGSDPAADLRNFYDDLLIADLDLVQKRIEKLQEQSKRPRPAKEREEQAAEVAFMEGIKGWLEAGKPLATFDFVGEQRKMIRSFQLFTEKPRMAIINTSDDDPDPQRFLKGAGLPADLEVVPLPLALQRDLSKMDDAERAAFCEEMQVAPCDRGDLLRRMMRSSGQMLFFTAGEKEVRTWMIRQGGTAVEAAGCIHTDLAKGFIRAETMTCNDLIRLGSEREIKAHNLLRKEPRDYVIQDGDILMIQHN